MNLANYLNNKSFILRGSNSDRYTYIFMALSIMTIIVSCNNKGGNGGGSGGVMGGSSFAGPPTLVLSSGSDADAEAKTKEAAEAAIDIEDLELNNPPPQNSETDDDTSSKTDDSSETDGDSETDDSSETSNSSQPKNNNGCITPTDKKFKALFMLKLGQFIFSGFGNASRCTNYYSWVTISIYTPQQELKYWNIVGFNPETIRTHTYAKQEFSSLFWFYDMMSQPTQPHLRTKPREAFEKELTRASRNNANDIRLMITFWKKNPSKPTINNIYKFIHLNNQETRALSKLAGYDVFGNPTPVGRFTSKGSAYYTLTDKDDLDLLKSSVIKIVKELDKDSQKKLSP